MITQIPTHRSILQGQIEQVEADLRDMDDEAEYDPTHVDYETWQSLIDRYNEIGRQINAIDGEETYQVENPLWYL